MNLGGAAQGYLNFVQQDQARAQQAQQMALVAQQMQAFQRQQEAVEQARGAQQKWGGVLQGMMGGQQPQPGMLPPPPGTMAGGPMPPGPGVSSAPPPGPQMPLGAIPPPPGAGAPPMGAPAQAAPPAQPTPPYKPMPTTPPMPPVPGATGAVPPPPMPPAQPPGPPMGGGQGQQFGLPQIIEGLKKANVPPEQWGVMLDNLPEPVKNNAAQEIKTMKDQQNFLIAWANSQTRAAGETRRTEQGDRKLDQGDEKIRQGDDRNATAKQLAEAKIKYMEAGGVAQFDDTDKQYWSGVLKNGGSLPAGLARDPAGRKFVQELMREVSHGDVSPKDMLGNQAEFQGEKAGQRTLGTRTANIEMAATEADQLADLALKASGELKRTGIKSLNTALQMVEKGTASPELRRFVAANTSFINAYARAINPQGVGTVADKEHAREMLDTAFSKGDYTAVIDQLKSEIGAAKASPGIVKGEMRERFVGGGSRKAAPQQAIDWLKAHPELAGDFSKKYGYLPSGARQ